MISLRDPFLVWSKSILFDGLGWTSWKEECSMMIGRKVHNLCTDLIQVTEKEERE
jgi:hypothetical protein